MSSEYRKIIDTWAPNQSLDETIITLFKKVRDIPYGSIGSRNPLEIYKQQQGTCSGKHELLKELYLELDIPVKNCIIMHSFNDLPVKYPKNIQSLLAADSIIDPHNFIKIKRKNRWITIDVTWDILLKKLNFPINEAWNGYSNLEISVVNGKDIYQTEKPTDLKKKLISEFPKSIQIKREIFLKEFTKWLQKSRK